MFSLCKRLQPDNPVQVELRRLSDLFRDGTSLAIPPEMLENNGRRAIWSIPLRDGGEAFVSAKKNAGINDEMYVVEVDADRFYYHWLRSTLESGGHCVPLQNMPDDYKYHLAEEGFAEGRKNPVPLAEVTAYELYGQDYVSFSNGITRSFWLLAHGAKSFPVEVHGQESAQRLHQLAGVGEEPKTLEHLFAVPAAES